MLKAESDIGIEFSDSWNDVVRVQKGLNGYWVSSVCGIGYEETSSTKVKLTHEDAVDLLRFLEAELYGDNNREVVRGEEVDEDVLDGSGRTAPGPVSVTVSVQIGDKRFEEKYGT